MVGWGGVWWVAHVIWIWILDCFGFGFGCKGTGLGLGLDKNWTFHKSPIFSWILQLHPFTKTAISPMSYEQIEKFQCLKSSTTLLKGCHMVSSEPMWHLLCVQNRNVSQSLSTLRSKKSINLIYLISLTPGPGHGMLCHHFAILHTSGQFFWQKKS